VSGFACVVGREAGDAVVHRMLETAPHRGPVRSTWSDRGVAVGVQGRSGEHSFVSGGYHVDPDVVTVGTGALFRGASVVTGEAAIRGVAEAHRAGHLKTLSGSFAAVFVERRTGRAVAVRSAVGERPLFWRREGASAAFASEVKQLAAWSDRPPVNEDAVLDLVAQRFERPERTTYQGIVRLLPGTTLEVAGEVTEQRFWRPGDGAGMGSVSFEEAVREFRRLLHQAVARRLGPGTVVLMSGGLDSTSVAAEAAPLHLGRYGVPLRVVSAAYPDHPAVDESGAIRATADALGCEVVWVQPRPRPFRDLVRRAWLHDGPDLAPLSSNLEEILAGARGVGITACLDGHDGDTVLGLSAGAVGALLRRGRWGTAARRVGFMRRRLGIGRARAVRRVLIPGMVDAVPGARPAWRRLRPPPDPWPSWVTEPIRRRDGAALDWYRYQADAVEGALVLSVENLERTAACSGVDLLHPYCDPDLVDFLLQLAPEVKLAAGATKALVRRAYLELPREVRDRVDKTRFNDVTLAGASRDEIVAEAAAVSKRLPGIDWSQLEGCLRVAELPFAERALLGRALSAELFLEST
jgi:asparagine synthetase B (glutamine-hydrolysing)